MRRPSRIAVTIEAKSSSSKTIDEAEAARTVLRVMELSNVHDDPAFRQLFTAQCIPDASAEQSQAFNQLTRIAGGTRASVSVLRALYDIDVRTMTLAEAFQAGADHIVVGRPIRNARDPRKAADAMQAEIAGIFQ